MTATPQQIEAAMSRALELAQNGPTFGGNPRVGAVILTEDGSIAAEGWHRGAGTKHAEVDALEKLIAAGSGERLPADYTAVVTLEPCNHTGRTGPCAQALVAAGVSTVVYAASDPGEDSSGGAETLRAAGIRVESGVLVDRAEELNRVWATAVRQGRPFVTLKWASSIDGRAAAADGTSKWISGPQSRADTHILRSEVDAILVGTGTVLADNPELTARSADGGYFEHQPLRVVLGERELASNLAVFNERAETVHLRTRSLDTALSQLFERGVRHLLVEGGPAVASEFIRAGLVNEFVIYLAPQLIGGRFTALDSFGVGSMDESIKLKFIEVTKLGDDLKIRAIAQKEN